MERTLRDWRAITIFVGPALLLFIVILVIPILWSFGYTFTEGSVISGFHAVGLSNYTRLVQDPAFWSAAWLSIKYAVLVSAGQVFFGLMLALLYSFYLKRSSALVRTLVFLPVVLPTVAVAQLFVKLFAITPQYGFLNNFLHLVHLDSAIQPWLGQGGTAFWVLVLMDVWKAMGLYAVLLYTGLMDISEETLEAARLDGASGWRLTQFIVLPLLTPVIVTSLIFSINGTLKVFDSVLALTAGGPGNATTPLTLYMYKTAFNYSEYGYGSTIAFALTALCLIVSLIIIRRSRED